MQTYRPAILSVTAELRMATKVSAAAATVCRHILLAHGHLAGTAKLDQINCESIKWFVEDTIL